MTTFKDTIRINWYWLQRRRANLLYCRWKTNFIKQCTKMTKPPTLKINTEETRNIILVSNHNLPRSPKLRTNQNRLHRVGAQLKSAKNLSVFSGRQIPKSHLFFIDFLLFSFCLASFLSKRKKKKKHCLDSFQKKKKKHCLDSLQMVLHTCWKNWNSGRCFAYFFLSPLQKIFRLCSPYF